jgi:hypothetical protein
MSFRPASCQSLRTAFLVGRHDAGRLRARGCAVVAGRHGSATRAMEVSVVRIVGSVHTFGGATATAAHS